MQKLSQFVYLRDLGIVIYGNFNSNNFFLNCSSHILVPFCWSVNCTSWTFDLNMNIYLRALSVAILQKFDFYYLCQFRFFFWSANCTILVCKLCLLSQTILNLWPVLILEIFLVLSFLIFNVFKCFKFTLSSNFS